MLLLLLPLLATIPTEETTRACAAQESRLTAQRAAVWSALEGHHRAAARYHAAREALPTEAQAEAFTAMTRSASVLRMVQAGAAVTAEEVAAAKALLGCPGVDSGS